MLRKPWVRKVLPVLFITLVIIFTAYLVSLAIPVPGSAEKPTAPRLIAHAGGEIYGIRLTNSLQAFDNSYSEGFRFFETDITLTSDNELILAHDWGNANWFMNVKYSTDAPTYKEFKSRSTIVGLQMMDLDMLAQWLSEHKDAYIVTDTKLETLNILKTISERYPDVYDRIIPQIYSFEEYDAVRDMGYKYIILTLYRIKPSDEEIIDFCTNHPLFALTIPQERAIPDVLNKLVKLDIPIYVHTINDYNVYVKLRDNGVYGVYTDYFQPSKWVE